MARKHWTQKTQSRRGWGSAIRDDGDTNATGSTWERRNDSKRYTFLAWTDKTTKIRRGIFLEGSGARDEIIHKGMIQDLKELGYGRVSLNYTVRDSDVKRDYRFKKFGAVGTMYGRKVYRI